MEALCHSESVGALDINRFKLASALFFAQDRLSVEVVERHRAVAAVDRGFKGGGGEGHNGIVGGNVKRRFLIVVDNNQAAVGGKFSGG